MSLLETLEPDAPLAPIAPAAPRPALVPVGRIDLNTMGFEEMQRVSQVLVACGFYKDVKEVAQAVAKLIVGQELGLTIYEAMTGIRFVEGKLEMAPALMGARINRSQEYKYKVERDDRDGEGIDNPRCVIAYYRKPDEFLGRMEWSHKDTILAQLAGKDNWKKYGRAMRWARCMSAGTKAFCGDIIGGGAIYVEGEIEQGSGYAIAPQNNVTPIASAPSAPVIEAAPAEDPVAAAKMRKITDLAGELMVTAARMNLDVEACDGDLDKLLALYEQKKSAKRPARGSISPAAPIPAPSPAGVVVVSDAAASMDDTPQAAVSGEPPVTVIRTLPGSVARMFVNTPFAGKADRLAFAAHHLALEGDLASFNDLSDEQLATVKEKLAQVMRLNREAAEEMERHENTRAATPAAPPIATPPVNDDTKWCGACGVPPGKVHFSGCEMVA